MSPQSRFLLLCVIVITETLMTSGASPSAREKSCRAVLTDFNRLQFKEIGVCSKSFTAKEKPQKSSCILKCVLQNTGLINRDGAVSTDQYNNYLKDKFPVSLQKRANNTFGPCMTLLKGLNLSNNQVTATNVQEDPLCKSYEPFIKCISQNSLRLCSGLV